MMNKKINLLLFSLFLTVAFATQTLAANPSWNVTQPVNTSQGYEDQFYVYNLTLNISNPDPDPVIFSFYTQVEGENPIVSDTHGTDKPVSYFYWINLSSSTGILTFNSTRDNQTGFFNVTVDLSIPGPQSFGTMLFLFNITPVNDAPQFQTLANQSFNRSELFTYVINITDEENNTPLSLNITFLDCIVANWSTRNCNGNYNNLTLFNSSQYSYNGTQLNISFTPTRNDVGNYTINFTITDSGNTTQPHNASRSQIVKFEVLNINEFPYFAFVCDDDQSTNATEDSQFSCYINATDIDELSYLNFSANHSWFNFSESNRSTVQILGQYNFSTLVRINASDAQVGNWVVNISVNDTGFPTGRNSTILYLNISNKNDSVFLSDIANVSQAFTTDNYVIQINATDDDLFILDKSIYNESITFSSTNENISFSNIAHVPNTNRYNATLTIDTSDWPGFHTINITVRDANNYSISSDTFTINISDNGAPQWISGTPSSFTLYENQAFIYNFLNNITDDPGEDINFSFVVNDPQSIYDNHEFDSFPVANSDTGAISFTPGDIDTGYWNVTITATDGKTSVARDFNFTVYNNVSDAPTLQLLYVSNGTLNETTRQLTFQEDNLTLFQLQLTDDDFLVLSAQQTFYDEYLRINITLQGPTPDLFSLSDMSSSIGAGVAVGSVFTSFTPQKADVGQYNLTINITDFRNESIVLAYNLTVIEISHPPVITDLDNKEFSILNETFYVNLNATDAEPCDSTTNPCNDTANPGNFTFTLSNLTRGGNFLTINSLTGVINFTFNSSHAGLWQYNVSVNDSDGDVDSDLFNLSVYDYPQIIFPNSSYQYNLLENQTYQLNFTANHSVLNNLTYTLVVNGISRNSTSSYGNGSILQWNFTPNFTDETTCTGMVNLTLNVSNSKLSNTTSWNLTINHTNYPISFYDNIESLGPGGSPIGITLSDYFRDLDASDTCINQTIGFSYTLVPNSTTGSITVTFVDWENATIPTASFSSGDDLANGTFSITAVEYSLTNHSQTINNATSNNFTVEIESESDEQPTPSSGSGGSGSGSRIVSLKIIVPGPVSAKQKDRIVVPISLVNDGDVDLRGILLSAYVAKDGLLRSDLLASFDRSSFEMLRAGQQEDLTMIVDIDTSATGLFEVTINATVENPEYSDWAKFFIQIEEDIDILERIIFTEEFIIGNPQCAEYVDLIEEAKALYNQGKPDAAQLKTEEALDACKSAIIQEPRARVYQRIGDKFFTYAAVASLGAFVLGFAYYSYRKVKLRRQIYGYSSYQGQKDKFY